MVLNKYTVLGNVRSEGGVMKRIRIFFKNWFNLLKSAKGFGQTIFAVFLGWFICLFFTDKELD